MAGILVGEAMSPPDASLAADNAHKQLTPPTVASRLRLRIAALASARWEWAVMIRYWRAKIRTLPRPAQVKRRPHCRKQYRRLEHPTLFGIRQCRIAGPKTFPLESSCRWVLCAQSYRRGESFSRAAYYQCLWLRVTSTIGKVCLRVKHCYSSATYSCSRHERAQTIE